MKPIILNRGQIGKAEGLDTTVKSAQGWLKIFAPTWQMVMDHKHGKITDEQYIHRYMKILDQIPKSIWETLYNHGLKTRIPVFLLCYCRDSAELCHTHLIITYAVLRFPEWFADGRSSPKRCDTLLELLYRHGRLM